MTLTATRFLYVLITLCLLLGQAAAEEQNLLQTDDINRIMKQIFERHVDKKTMSAAILKKSFRVYIDQFDPRRIYLMEAEVRPFLEMTDAQLNVFAEQYQKSQFAEYKQLNDTIQKAIERARTLRAQLETPNELSQLFAKSSTVASDGNDGWEDPDLKKGFAGDQSDLLHRIKHDITEFIAKERRRYGSEYVSNRQTQTIRLYERQAKDHENQYLYTDDNGQPMSESEKQNAFAMHVLKALASSLDSHTTVLNPTEAYDMRVRLEKEMEGVGIVLQPSPEGFAITQLVDSGPAAKSGLVHIHDKLIEVDGTPVRTLDMKKVMELLRGKKGTQVDLLLARTTNGSQKETQVKVTLTRDEIPVNEDRAKFKALPYDHGIIGVIRLDSFYQSDNGVDSETDVRNAIQKLDQNGNLRGLILDLRENSGGFLSQAVRVAGLFITNGVIVVSKYFNGEEHFYRDMDGKVSYDGPLIVLTSKATASAAEIVAQALQDYGVALVVGDEQTYGKGTIQSQTVTEDKASTFFKVTVGKYYTVSGKTPQLDGVKADIVAPSEFVHDTMGEEYLEYPIKQDTIPPSFNDNLSDIAPNLKPWYMRYYAPTLQHRKLFWRNILPELKRDSAERIRRNPAYQQFLKGTEQPGQKIPNIEEIQLQEAVSVLKDMINFQAQQRGNEPNLQGSSAHPMGIKPQ